MLIDIWWLVPAVVGSAAAGVVLGAIVAVGGRATDDKLADEDIDDPNWRIVGAGDPGLTVPGHDLPRTIRTLPGGGGKPGRAVTPDMIRDGRARLDLVHDYGPLPPAPPPESEWTDWYAHDGGECPIPWANAGQFEIKFRSGATKLAASLPAALWAWPNDNFARRGDIVAYRVLKSAIPPGWKPRPPASTEGEA